MKKYRILRFWIALSMVCLLLTYCKKESEITLPESAEAVFVPVPIDSVSIVAFLKERPDYKEFEKDFMEFYRSNSYHYAWYNSEGMLEFAHLLTGYLMHEDKDGIYAQMPYRDEFLQRVNFTQSDSIPAQLPNRPDLTTELMLTGSYFFYARNSWGGGIAQKVTDWHLPKKALNYSELLTKNLKNQSLKELEAETVIPQYLGLKQQLNAYREQLKKGEETQIDFKGVLKEKDSSEHIVLVRKRLTELGYPATGDSPVYDKELLEVINRFRKNHGLHQNGQINASVVQELNVSIANRIEQIQVNMERFRWIRKGERPTAFILVNIPEYRLHYFEKDAETWSCDVVVGKAMHQTVIFSGMMSYLVFSPYWNIPNSIVQNEIKPAAAKDPNYLSRNNIEIYKGMYRQKPGVKNSLGLVKFMFPNSNNIYLHDTPSKSLFNQEVRSFSQGCIRVSEPKTLAMKILKNQPKWTEEKIDAAMKSGVEQNVPLKEKIPVYIGYFTAFVDRDGDLNFRKDIYDLDSKMLRLLKGDN